MNLDEVKKQTVAAWIEQGLKLSEIQGKLASELGLNLTYMEVRLLVDDLKLTPKDQAVPQAVTQISSLPDAGEAVLPETEAPSGLPGSDQAAPKPGAGGVAVSVDLVARPGAMVSGNVTFSDGNSAAWHLDQLGRLGLVPKQAGYRPPAQDLQTFQVELQNELQKLGL